MIQKGTVLVCADNSGASLLRCIGIIGGTYKYSAYPGDVIVVSVIASTTKKLGSKLKVAKGSVHRAVVVRTKHRLLRADGSTLSFDSNAAVLINKSYEPLGTRVFGAVPRELKEDGSFLKIISLAQEVL